MKIVYIAYSTIPSRTANSIHVMKMCQALAQNGNEVILLVPGQQKDIEPGINDLFTFYGVEPCFIIKYIPSFPTIMGRIFNGWLAANEINTITPDLVYCRDILVGYFAALRNVKVYYESHGPERERKHGWIIEWLFQRLIMKPAFCKLIVISRSLRDYYSDRYPSLSDKIVVAPDGADPVPENVERLSVSSNDKNLQVGYVGHLYPGKGMEIISNLVRRCSYADFHIVGGTEKDIAYWEKNIRNAKNLYFHGFIPHLNVNKYILSFDVVLLPNQKHVSVAGGKSDIGKWTSPLKLFEYMAAGKAIICSDLPVLREILTDKQNSFLCDPEDISAWESALFFLSNNPSERIRIGENAKKDFFSKYTWRMRAEKVISDFN